MEKNEFAFPKIDPEGFFENVIFTRDDALKMISKRAQLFQLDELFIKKLKMNPEETHRNKVCIDMNHEFFSFCMKKNFSAEKIAIFLNIFDFCIFYGLFKKFTALDINEHILRLLKKHGRHTPPYSIGVFSEKEIKEIVFFANQQSKNFFLYEIALTRFIDYNIFSRESLGVNLPILPLDSGTIIKAEDMVKINGLSMYMEMAEGSEEEAEEEEEEENESPFKLDPELGGDKVNFEEDFAAIPKTDEQIFFEQQVEEHLRRFQDNVQKEISQKEEDVENKLRVSYPKLFPAQKKK